jgi:hypothetical protein
MENITTSNLSDAEKLNMLIDALNTNDRKMNANILAEKLGYKSHMAVYHVTSGKNKLTDDMIEKIILKMPQVNYLFLKKGIGKPLKSKSSAQLQENLLNFSKKEVTLGDIGEMPRRLVYIETMLERLMAHLLPEELEDMISNEDLMQLSNEDRIKE